MHRVIVPADEKNTKTKIIHPYKGSETQQEIDEMIKTVIDNTIANEKNEKIYSELGLLSEK